MQRMKESMPTHVRRGIAALVAVVLAIMLLRLATQVRNLQARVDALEAATETAVAMHPAATGSVATDAPEDPRPHAAHDTPPPSAVAQSPKPVRQPEESHTPQPTATPQAETGKFRTPTRVELNTADSATLVRIPGIAGRTAQAILAYREQLGGYVAPRQLEERLTWDAARERMDEWCSDWLTADPTLVRRLDVNTAPFRTLLRHPYLDYPQVQQIVRYRDRHRRLPGLEALRQLDAFTEADIARLAPYLTFGPDAAASSQPATDPKEEDSNHRP